MAANTRPRCSWGSLRPHCRRESGPGSGFDLELVDVHQHIARAWIRFRQHGEHADVLSTWKNRALPTEPALVALRCVLVDDGRLVPVNRDRGHAMVGRYNAVEPDAGTDKSNRAGVAGHARVCVRAVRLEVCGREAPRTFEVALVDPGTHHFVRNDCHPVHRGHTAHWASVDVRIRVFDMVEAESLDNRMQGLFD